MFFFKNGDRKVKQEKKNGDRKVLSGGWNQSGGKDIKKGRRRVKMAEILCTHVCKWKNETF
jgi:hypothetical protein